jgi:cytochrome c556
MRVVVVVAALLVIGCGPPQKSTPIEEIPKLTKLDDVMDNQATVADPQFKKIGQAAFSDADYAAFIDTATRLQATSVKIKDFSKGAEFDALAMRLNEKSRALGDAGQAKNAANANAALKDLKATCKECHSKFR